MNLRKAALGAAVVAATVGGGATALAQLRDATQISPLVPGGHITKSLAQETGTGRGHTEQIGS
jgi:hypothetical protein